jgi:hypothetical protein
VKARFLVAATAIAVVCACNSPVEYIPPKITALKAYYCAVPGQAQCLSQGAPIPDGTLPPSNEAFQVWAFYQGWVTTHWVTVISDSVPVDSTQTGCSQCTPDKFTPDSSVVWINLHGAPAPHYTVRVMIRGAAGYLTNDSLRWNFH